DPAPSQGGARRDPDATEVLPLARSGSGRPSLPVERRSRTGIVMVGIALAAGALYFTSTFRDDGTGGAEPPAETQGGTTPPTPTSVPMPEAPSPAEPAEPIKPIEPESHLVVVRTDPP